MAPLSRLVPLTGPADGLALFLVFHDSTSHARTGILNSPTPNSGSGLYRGCFAARRVLYRVYRPAGFSHSFVAFCRSNRDTDDTKQRCCDIRAIPAVPRMARQKGHAMTKTISIYAAQILLGVIAIAFGYAKLTGAGHMVQQFQAIASGRFSYGCGIAEIVAGICLLLPRCGGVLGAVLLTCVMVGALGVIIGNMASSIAAPSFATTTYQANHNSSMIQIFRQRAEWDI